MMKIVIILIGLYIFINKSKTKNMELTQDQLDAIELAANQILDEIDADVDIDKRELYEMFAEKIEVNGKTLQIVVKFIVASEHHIDEDQIYYKDLDVDAEKEV